MLFDIRQPFVERRRNLFRTLLGNDVIADERNWRKRPCTRREAVIIAVDAVERDQVLGPFVKFDEAIIGRGDRLA